MAALDKYTSNAVIYAMRHNTRENPRPPKNTDIDSSKSQYNYSLTPESRGSTARENKDYYNERIHDVYHYNRADVKTACQWVITAPKDLSPEYEKHFFKETYNYLNSLYGETNCVQAIVHYDEGIKNANGEVIEGQPHLHYMFIPVIENNRYMQPNKSGNITTAATYKEKVCADQLINKQHLQNFHPKYQQWLDKHGIHCTVHSGITNGNNKTVEELKYITKELELSRQHIYELEKENKALKEHNISLEKELSKQREVIFENQSAWGTSSGWGKDIEAWTKEY